MTTELNKMLAKMIVPEEILESFEIEKIEEHSEEYIVELREKRSELPKSILRKGKAVLDGFMPVLELQSFPIQGKSVYLRLYRRRWKERGGGERNFTNDYNFQEKGMKATRAFGAFLKELGRG